MNKKKLITYGLYAVGAVVLYEVFKALFSSAQPSGSGSVVGALTASDISSDPNTLVTGDPNSYLVSLGLGGNFLNG